jgi:hypothetical protein
MADIDWKTTPHRALDTPRCLCGDGKPIPSGVYGRWRATWEISKKTGERGEWKVIAKGTADSFEAAKAAALLEAGA